MLSRRVKRRARISGNRLRRCPAPACTFDCCGKETGQTIPRMEKARTDFLGIFPGFQIAIKAYDYFFENQGNNKMQKAVILMGSKSDQEFCEKIRATITSYFIAAEMRIASAHRTPEYLLKILKEYYDSGDEIVAVTVAGLSDALSGV